MFADSTPKKILPDSRIESGYPDFPVIGKDVNATGHNPLLSPCALGIFWSFAFAIIRTDDGRML
jgi:hypothetical protein